MLVYQRVSHENPLSEFRNAAPAGCDASSSCSWHPGATRGHTGQLGARFGARQLGNRRGSPTLLFNSEVLLEGISYQSPLLTIINHYKP